MNPTQFYPGDSPALPSEATPETNAAEQAQEDASEYRGHLVQADFARNLELERNSLRARVDALENVLAESKMHLEQAGYDYRHPMWQSITKALAGKEAS